MKIKSICVLAMLLLPVVIMPVSASINNTTADLMPSLKEGWYGLPPTVQTWVKWIIGISFVALVVIAIAFTSGSGIWAIVSGHSGNVSGRSSGLGDMFMPVGILIAAIVAIMFILYIASSI